MGLKEGKGKKEQRIDGNVWIGVVILMLILLSAVIYAGIRSKNEDFEEYTHPVGNSEEQADIVVQDGLCVTMFEVEVKNTATGARKAVGTGVVCQSDGEGAWIVTAAHVLAGKGAEDRIILNYEENSIECTLWYEEKTADLAYLYLAKEEMGDAFIAVPMETNKVKYDALKEEDVVWALGYTEGRFVEYSGVLSDTWIYVEDFEQHMMVAECDVRHGMSGGALCDEAGNFVGMICGGNEKGELVAVPWHVIQARLEEIGE